MWGVHGRKTMRKLQSSWRTWSCISSASLKSLKFLPMPMLSPTMEIGAVTAWHIAAGQHVEPYQLVVEISALGLTSDTKENGRTVNMDIEIMEDMLVGRLLQKIGVVCPVGTPLVVFCEGQSDLEQLQQLSDEQAKELMSRYNAADVTQTALWQGYLQPEEKGRSDVTGCGCS